MIPSNESKNEEMLGFGLPPELTQLPHAAVGFLCFSEVCLVRGSLRWTAPAQSVPRKRGDTKLFGDESPWAPSLFIFSIRFRSPGASWLTTTVTFNVVKCTISHPAASRARTR